MKVIELYNHLDDLIKNKRKRDCKVLYFSSDNKEHEIKLVTVDEDDVVILSDRELQ